MTTEALKINPEQYKPVLDSLAIVPTRETMDAIAADVAARCTLDEQLAPIWAEQLRHTYTKTLEVKYPEYAAANGDVLPIDTSVDPASDTWEYFMVDQQGYADWIDDDGMVMPSGSMTAERFIGYHAELGHKYEVNVFDLERAAKQSTPNVPLVAMKQKNAKRTHDAKTNYVWLFGDSGKSLPGLCNHPNIPVTRAANGASPVDEHFGGKDVDEMLADFATLITTVSDNTIRAWHVGTVFMPEALWQRLRDTRLGAGDGFASALDLLRNRYAGDESGQGKVEFKILNECTATRRLDPKTGTDTSGIVGDFMLALPAGASKDEMAFIRSRPFTQRPPQERDFVMYHNTHSKIGGCKCQIPLAVHRVDFGVPA